MRVRNCVRACACVYASTRVHVCGVRVCLRLCKCACVWACGLFTFLRYRPIIPNLQLTFLLFVYYFFVNHEIVNILLGATSLSPRRIGKNYIRPG